MERVDSKLTIVSSLKGRFSEEFKQRIAEYGFDVEETGWQRLDGKRPKPAKFQGGGSRWQNYSLDLRAPKSSAP